MGRSFLFLACLVVSVAACAYDFGGGAGGAGSTSTVATTGELTAGPSASSADAATSASIVSAASTGADTVTTTTATASSSAESSSSTGSVVLTPCVQDDFESFDSSGPPAWTEFGANGASVMPVAGTVQVIGSQGADGAYISMPMHPSNCYISTSFAIQSGNPNVYIDVRHDDENVVSLSRRSSDVVRFEVVDAGMTTSQDAPATMVDALVLVFAEPTITAYQRSSSGVWTMVGNPQALPAWFADDPVDGTGFGLVDSVGGSVRFADFSVVPPP